MEIAIKKRTIYYVSALIIAAILIYFSFPLITSQNSSYAALVNNEPITIHEFNTLYNSLSSEQQASIDKKTFMEDLINLKLLEQAASGYHATKDEINETMMSIEALAQKQGFDNIDDYLEKQGMTKEEYTALVRQRIVISKYLNDTLSYEISEQEIIDYYENNSDAFSYGEQVKASHILLNTTEEAELVLSMANRTNFGELAREYSEGPSSAVNGSLGWFGRGQMIQEFEDAVFNLSVGEISGIVKTQYGYHIIMLEDKREAGTYPLEDVKDQIRDFLSESKRSKELSKLLEDMRKKADVKIFI